MKFPIAPDTPEMQLAEAIATDLAIEGFNPGLALPVAIHLMAVIDAAHNDPLKGVKQLQEDRKRSDEWWVQYHPRSKFAQGAKRRLENQ